MVKVKRKRSRSYSTIKRDLDRVFSSWTRLRFANPEGRVQCVTCGKQRFWRADGMDAGHFVSRSRLATRWHPENVAPQCNFPCNKWKGGGAEYCAWGVNRYGMDWPSRMVALSKTQVKYSRTDLEALILDYETKLEIMAADRADAL